MAKRSTKAARDNRSNQLNPKHSTYWSSRGVSASKGSAPAERPKGASQTPSVDKESDK